MTSSTSGALSHDDDDDDDDDDDSADVQLPDFSVSAFCYTQLDHILSTHCSLYCVLCLLLYVSLVCSRRVHQQHEFEIPVSPAGIPW